MLDARKLKRNQIFNVSITEIILLLLFLLLLLFGFFYKNLSEKYKELEKNLTDLTEINKNLQNIYDLKKGWEDERKKWINTTGFTGPGQINDEWSKLVASTENLRDEMYYDKDKMTELRKKIIELEKLIKMLETDLNFNKTTKDIISELKKKIEEQKKKIEELKKKIDDKVNIEDLDKKLKDITKFNKILKDAKPDQVDDLINGLDVLLNVFARDFDKLLKEIDKLAGNAIPACWPKAYPEMTGKDVERIFTIRLQSQGIWVEKDFNSKFEKEYNYLNISNNNFRKPLSPSLFLETFSDLFKLSELDQPNALSITEQRRCRHEVRIFDETKDSEKIKYIEQLAAVESYFYKYQDSDKNYDYCTFRAKYRNDNNCIYK